MLHLLSMKRHRYHCVLCECVCEWVRDSNNVICLSHHIALFCSVWFTLNAFFIASSRQCCVKHGSSTHPLIQLTNFAFISSRLGEIELCSMNNPTDTNIKCWSILIFMLICETFAKSLCKVPFCGAQNELLLMLSSSSENRNSVGSPLGEVNGINIAVIKSVKRF